MEEARRSPFLEEVRVAIRLRHYIFILNGVIWIGSSALSFYITSAIHAIWASRSSRISYPFGHQQERLSCYAESGFRCRDYLSTHYQFIRLAQQQQLRRWQVTGLG
jgi:hypothetical protein